MIRVVRRLLERRGYEVRRPPPTNGRELDLLLRVVRAENERDPGGAVVQVGANDGNRNDPIRALWREDRFPTVCIEPVPDLAAALRENVAGLANVTVREHAVGREQGALSLYRIDPQTPGCPDWAFGMVSADPELLRRDRRLKALGRSAVQRLKVPQQTLGDVYREEDLNRVLLLQIDVEGFDDRVVEMALGESLRPRIIHFEHKHLPLDRNTRIRDRLTDAGYGLASWNGEDTLAVAMPREGAP